MIQTKNKVSSVQVFFLIFGYMLSGFRIYGGSSLVSVVFICLFCVCVSIIAFALCENMESFRELSALALGKYGWLLGGFACVLSALPLVKTLIDISEEISSFYKSASRYVILLIIVSLCFFAVWRGFCVAGRFAEVGALALICILPLSLLGGGGAVFDFSFSDDLLFRSFGVVGSVPVFFSLCLRNIADRENMSVFAKSSSFHPSPMLCSVWAVIAAAAVHVYLRLVGAESIISHFLLCFFYLVRVFVFFVSVSDILALPETVSAQKRVKRISGFVGVCFVAVILNNSFPNAFQAIITFGSVGFPCLVFSAISLKGGYREKTS